SPDERGPRFAGDDLTAFGSPLVIEVGVIGVGDRAVAGDAEDLRQREEVAREGCQRGGVEVVAELAHRQAGEHRRVDGYRPASRRDRVLEERGPFLELREEWRVPALVSESAEREIVASASIVDDE